MDKAYQFCIEELKKGKDLVFAMIESSTGSTPRHAGAGMVVDLSGRIEGSIGGGTIEYEAIAIAKDCLLAKKDQRISIQMKDPDEMICGGSAQVCCKYLSAGMGDEAINWLRMTHDRYFVEEGQIHIFGSGHVAAALAPVLKKLGFVVNVWDDREDLMAEAKIIDYSNLAVTVGAGDYVVVATRGHAFDIEVLRYLLKKPVKYLGAVGSRKKALYVREVLEQEGFRQEELNRIITPIGVSIGSETPEEIAISIAAQIISVRRGLSYTK